MVASALIVKGDTEELALNLIGKKRKIRRKDFDAVLSSFKILDEKAIENIYQKFSISIQKWIQFIARYSFRATNLYRPTAKDSNVRDVGSKAVANKHKCIHCYSSRNSLLNLIQVLQKAALFIIKTINYATTHHCSLYAVAFFLLSERFSSQRRCS
jgi:hypothetical protein